MIKLSCSLYLWFLLLAWALRLKKSSCCSHSPTCITLFPSFINLTTNRLDILGVEKKPKSNNLTLHPVFYAGHYSCVRNKMHFVNANGKFIPYGTCSTCVLTLLLPNGNATFSFCSKVLEGQVPYIQA